MTVQRLRGWRRLAAATWGAPRDPQFYGDLEVDASRLVAYVEDVRKATGVRLTVTHLVGKAVAVALAEQPDVNGSAGFGRFRPRDGVDVFFIVAADAGRELTGIKVRGTDHLPVVEVAAQIDARHRSLQSGGEDEMAASKALMNRLPAPLLGPALRFTAFLTNDLGLDLRRLGIPDQPFGGVMISSIGMWGVAKAYSPLAPYYRIPFLALVGAVEDRPVAVDGEVVVRPMLTVTATFDHRYLDGFQAARMATTARAYLQDPAAYEPPLG